MSRSSAFWQTTCSALRSGCQPGWEAVESYRQPLQLFLARRFPRLPEAARLDIVQEVLLAIRERLFERYDARRGPFRAYLSGVIHNQVRRHFRDAGRTRPLDGVPEPMALPASDLTAIELSAELLGAIRRWHDRHCLAGETALPRLYVLTGRLVHGLSYKQIAAREKMSTDQVKRILSSFRIEVLEDLLRTGLHLPKTELRAVDMRLLAQVARAALSRPRKRSRQLQRIAGTALREALEAWLLDFEAALEHLGRAEPAEDLRRGLEMLLDDA